MRSSKCRLGRTIKIKSQAWVCLDKRKNGVKTATFELVCSTFKRSQIKTTNEHNILILQNPTTYSDPLYHESRNSSGNTSESLPQKHPRPYSRLGRTDRCLRQTLTEHSPCSSKRPNSNPSNVMDSFGHSRSEERASRVLGLEDWVKNKVSECSREVKERLERL